VTLILISDTLAGEKNKQDQCNGGNGYSSVVNNDTENQIKRDKMHQPYCIMENSSSDAFAEDTKKVFILHSYNEGHICGQPQHDGVINQLNENGFIVGDNLSVYTYYMETKSKNNTPKLIQEQGKLALEKIRVFGPDVLVTLDDNAFRTVALELADTALPIVFSGMNGRPEKYDKMRPCINSWDSPGHNITGVYEKLHIADAFRVHSNLFPGLKKITLITDYSPTGKAIYSQILHEFIEQQPVCRWEILIAKSWENYQEIITEINNDPDVGGVYDVALLLNDKEGKTYTAPDIIKWTLENSKKPEIAVNYAFVKLGYFGGAAVDFFAMGKEVGLKAVKILKGQNAGDIPITQCERYALAFNLSRAKALNLTVPDEYILASDDIFF